MNESEYLRKQAEDAREAVSKAMGGLVSNSANLANPKRWTRSHPWAGLAAAAIGGFLLAETIVAPKRIAPEIDESKFLRKVKNYVHGVVAAAKGEAINAGDKIHDAVADGKSNHSAEDDASPSGWAATILKEAFHFARPIVSSLVAAQFAKATVDSEQHNGHPHTADAPSETGGKS
jgi:hypothetical protein